MTLDPLGQALRARPAAQPGTQDRGLKPVAQTHSSKPRIYLVILHFSPESNSTPDFHQTFA